MISLILETDDKNSLRKVIEAAGGIVTIEYDTVDMLAAEVPLQTVKEVLANPHVLRAHKDRVQRLV